jgi:methionyl-tRNA formyltransferase
MDKKDLRVVFMGTPEFAVESLKAIHESGFQIAAVITACDKPAGRGRKLQESAVKVYAQNKGFKVLQPENLKSESFLKDLSDINPDVQVVVAFRMLPEVVWALPEFGTINLHASLLPQYRGAAPINHAIINGESVTGLTTFFIEKEIDTGKIIMQREVAILPDENAGELHDKLMVEGGRLLVETLEALLAGNIQSISQTKLLIPGELVKTASKIFKENCIIRWNDTAEHVYNFIRGLSPYPTAWTLLEDQSGKQISLKIMKSVYLIEPHVYKPGTIISDNKSYLRFAVSDGYIQIIELQQEGKKKMKTHEWLNGFDISCCKTKDLSF